MSMVNKDEYPEIFIENEDLEKKDVAYLENLNFSDKSPEENLFFKKMKEKIEGEFAVGMDQLLHEDDNEDRIYVIRYYYTEFLIGKVFDDNVRKKIYMVSFADAMNANLYPLLKRNISFLEWLRLRNFHGINYFNNSYIKRYGGYKEL